MLFVSTINDEYFNNYPTIAITFEGQVIYINQDINNYINYDFNKYLITKNNVTTINYNPNPDYTFSIKINNTGKLIESGDFISLPYYQYDGNNKIIKNFIVAFGDPSKISLKWYSGSIYTLPVKNYSLQELKTELDRIYRILTNSDGISIDLPFESKIINNELIYTYEDHVYLYDYHRCDRFNIVNNIRFTQGIYYSYFVSIDQIKMIIKSKLFGLNARDYEFKVQEVNGLLSYTYNYHTYSNTYYVKDNYMINDEFVEVIYHKVGNLRLNTYNFINEYSTESSIQSTERCIDLLEDYGDYYNILILDTNIDSVIKKAEKYSESINALIYTNRDDKTYYPRESIIFSGSLDNLPNLYRYIYQFLDTQDLLPINGSYFVKRKMDTDYGLVKYDYGYKYINKESLLRRLLISIINTGVRNSISPGDLETNILNNLNEKLNSVVAKYKNISHCEVERSERSGNRLLIYITTQIFGVQESLNVNIKIN